MSCGRIRNVLHFRNVLRGELDDIVEDPAYLVEHSGHWDLDAAKLLQTSRFHFTGTEDIANNWVYTHTVGNTRKRQVFRGRSTNT